MCYFSSALFLVFFARLLGDYQFLHLLWTNFAESAEQIRAIIVAGVYILRPNLVTNYHLRQVV